MDRPFRSPGRFGPRSRREDPPISTRPWTTQNALELYNVPGWGIGFFGINEKGRAVVHPDADPKRGIDLYDLAMDLNEQGVGLPILLRFSDILRIRIQTLNECFAEAIREIGYKNRYTAVFPIKVNQQRHVVQEIVEFGRKYGVGLEVGSKPELQAALALTEDTSHLIICNGYKDEEYMRLALMGQKLGHKVFIVLEMEQELDQLLKVAADMGVKPAAGVRIKLTSTGTGRWAQSVGEKSKFGLNPAQLVNVVRRLREADALDILNLVHFHLGSQIPDIRTVKLALSEVARFYVELRALGVNLTHVDVGGGLGVDYEGSRTTQNSSVNYSIQEYANDIVYTLAEVCSENDLPMPHIVSESGRALTAHHALLLVNVIDAETTEGGDPVRVDPENDHQILTLLHDSLEGLSSRSVREVYHDALFGKERARELFNSGVLSLEDASRAERLYISILRGIARIAEPQAHEDILAEIMVALTDRYFLNFSLFQSLPDSWAIEQLFPIMPIHRLNEEPQRRATLHDVTCDSDGKIEDFAGGRRKKKALEIHSIRPGEPYILGIFLTGAYQETLGDLHNLFGDTNAVHVRLREGGHEISDQVAGDTVTDVLEYCEYKTQDLVTTFRRKVARNQSLTREEKNSFIAEFVDGLDGYTYLEGPLGEKERAEAEEVRVSGAEAEEPLRS